MGAYDGALTANLTRNVALAGISDVMVLWLQNARGFRAVEAGMLMLPSTKHLPSPLSEPRRRSSGR